MGCVLLYLLVRGNIFLQLRHGISASGAGIKGKRKRPQDGAAGHRCLRNSCDRPDLHLFLCDTGGLSVCRVWDAAGGLHLRTVCETGIFSAPVYLPDESGNSTDRVGIFQGEQGTQGDFAGDFTLHLCDDRFQRLQDASVHQRLSADFPADLCALGAFGDCAADGGYCG